MTTTHPAADILRDMEDDVRTVPELLTAAMLLAEQDRTSEGRALLRVIAVARSTADAVETAWEQAFNATRGRA